jgi:hypothetical protein
MTHSQSVRRWVAEFVVAAGVLAFVPAVVFARSSPAAPPAVGESARDFTLRGVDGQAVALSSLEESGPVVVLMLRGWVGYQ